MSISSYVRTSGPPTLCTRTAATIFLSYPIKTLWLKIGRDHKCSERPRKATRQGKLLKGDDAAESR
jgi:hypothetical protein